MLAGVSVKELGNGGMVCDGVLGLWTILICVGVALLGPIIICVFVACCWRCQKRKKKKRKRNSDDKTMWDDVWRPENHIATTHVPSPPPPNGDSSHYPLTSPTRLGPPPDHPLHHLHHHHHQGCLQQCPYAALQPVYHPLLHPDHNSTHTSFDTPMSFHGDSDHVLTPGHASTITSIGPPLPFSDPPNWYATIGGGAEEDSGRESRPVTPLEVTNSPRKVPVTYV